VDGETPGLKILLPLPEFPIASVPEETNDRFRTRVELTAENVLWSYVRGEHDACIAEVPNECWFNRVFEQAAVPFGPCLEPSSKASKEALRKSKNDAGAKPAGKHTKVSGWKPTALKAPEAKKVRVGIRRRLLHRKLHLLH
jgi:hypothetical protein